MFLSDTCKRLALLTPVALILVVAAPLQASETDARIVTSINNSYNFKVNLAADKISVKSEDGVVTLTGNVAEDFHRSLAEETALDMPGVKSVKNEIMLNGMPSENSDGWVTMKVKGALAYHRNVSAIDTEVFTNGGVVTLKGRADNDAQRTLTGEYAADVVGVKSVDNQMTVKGMAKRPETAGQKIDDASITAQIKTSLLFHRSTHALATKVTTRKGVVILHGEVANAAEKSLVGKLAEDTQGVKKVENRMTVKPS